MNAINNWCFTPKQIYPSSLCSWSRHVQHLQKKPLQSCCPPFTFTADEQLQFSIKTESSQYLSILQPSENLPETKHAQRHTSKDSRGILDFINQNIYRNRVIYLASFCSCSVTSAGCLWWGVKSCLLHVDPSCSVPTLWETAGHDGLCSCVPAQLDISPSGCPRRPPGLTALSRRCPGSWGQGSRGRSGWSRIPSCGEFRSTPPCPTRLWCWTCQWWRWGVGPRPWSAVSGPEETEEGGCYYPATTRRNE